MSSKPESVSSQNAQLTKKEGGEMKDNLESLAHREAGRGVASLALDRPFDDLRVDCPADHDDAAPRHGAPPAGQVFAGEWKFLHQDQAVIMLAGYHRPGPLRGRFRSVDWERLGPHE